ncbi:MAG: ATP-binding protein [Candidatus Hadarchaeales archaeon]
MYIVREITEKFRAVEKVYNLIAVVGARQSGKTTFLKEQMKNVRSSYVLFDDPDARSLFEEDVKKFEKQYVEGYDVTVLDEVQQCKDAGRKLKYLADTGRRVWMTSSSEIILGKEILSHLVGRVSIIRLYPFSLPEFLIAKGQKEITQPILERSIWEHITYGGYPKVVLTDDVEMKKTILKDLYETMILKDVAQTFSIEDIRNLEEFVKYLSAGVGGALSYERISGALKIAFQTVKKYLNAMEKSYLIALVPPFFRNKHKEITKQPKVYFIDTGLKNAVANSFGEPDGRTFENYVFTELLKLGFMPKYWRTKAKAEVDFIIEKDGWIIPVEAKLTAGPGKIEKSLRSFIESYKPKIALVVTYKGEKGEMDIGGCKVLFTDVLEMRKYLVGGQNR